MINIGQVFETFQLLSDLSEPDAQKWLGLCADAGRQLTDMLRGGADLTTYTEAMIYAAAALAFYRYMLVKCAADQDTGSISIGDVKITKNASDTLKIAERIKDDALAALSGAFADRSFLFQGI